MTARFSLLERLREGGVCEKTLSEVADSLHEKTYERGSAILRQGDLAPNIFFLKRGLAKLVYLTAEGKEFIKSFIDEGNFMGSLVSQIEGGGSTFSIICLETSHVESVPYILLDRLAQQDSTVLQLFNILFRNLALKKEHREHDFLCLSPEERYRKFLTAMPRIPGRISQNDIALYLGITPVALSRIKSRMRV